MSERVRQHLAGEPAEVEEAERILRLMRDDPAWALSRIQRAADLEREHGLVRVGSEREGWRARLANVERLLTEATVEDIVVTDGGLVREALREVRSMIDGDETPA